MRTRFACPSVEAVQRLDRLEAELAHRFQGRFIVAGWESADAGARIAALTERMAQSLGPAARISAVA